MFIYVFYFSKQFQKLEAAKPKVVAVVKEEEKVVHEDNDWGMTIGFIS
jgi:hypothetical protein